MLIFLEARETSDSELTEAHRAARWSGIVAADGTCAAANGSGIGYFHLGTAEETTHPVAGFRKGLAEIGYIEGRNVTIEFRYGNNQFAELANLTADLVRRRVAVIAVPTGGTAALAAKAATTTIPIVFGSAIDPVEIGLVASLAKTSRRASA